MAVAQLHVGDETTFMQRKSEERDKIIKLMFIYDKKRARKWRECDGFDRIVLEMSDEEKNLCEAKFEILTSEFVYMTEIQNLHTSFKKLINSNKDILCDFTWGEKKFFASNLKEESARCEGLFTKLIDCFDHSRYMEGIFEVLQKSFNDILKKTQENPLINLVLSHQDVINTIKVHRLKNKKLDSFIEKRLERDNLKLSEQLLRPMQHMLGIKTKLENCLKILNELEESACSVGERASCQEAHEAVKQVLDKVNKLTHNQVMVRSLIEIQIRLQFPRDMDQLSLVSDKRRILKEGPVKEVGFVHMVHGDCPSVNTYWKIRCRRLFLFNDLIILAKEERSSKCMVVDYGHQIKATTPMHGIEVLGAFNISKNKMKDSRHYYPLCISTSMHHQKREGYTILSCNSEEERRDWLLSASRCNVDCRLSYFVESD